MSDFTFKVELRNETGRQGVKALRRRERLPGIFYGHGRNPIPVAMDPKELSKLLHEEVTIFDVVFPDGKTVKSVIKEVQKDPVTDMPIHVDLMGVRMEEKIRIMIPVVFKGSPIGVKEGGILEHALREVEVEGLPLDIPDHLEVDVTGLKIGEGITLAGLKTERFKFVTDIHHPVAHVTLPKVKAAAVTVEEEAAVAEAETAEKTPAAE